jgi:1-acyl-sn-glycerol-3-phosphate acyltransferase
VSRFWHEPDAVLASMMKLIRGQSVPANWNPVYRRREVPPTTPDSGRWAALQQDQRPCEIADGLGHDDAMASDAAGYPLAYRVVLAVGGPIMRRWSRMTVTGLDCVPRTGPLLIVGDHDSYWDPIAIAVAMREVRQIRALAKSSLWNNKIVASFMNGMGHIPVERGISNEEAMTSAIEELRRGTCIGLFPEGTRSLGQPLRARSGVGRLAEAVPEAVVVCARTNGSVDVVRIPKRPSVSVEFFLPNGGQQRPGESAAEFSERLVAELRDGAPYEIPGRKRTAAKYRANADSDQQAN